MATETGNHQISAFVTPTTGSALESSVIRTNLNTIQAAYVAHDDDPGIHLQSGTLPIAGTAGRKWVTATTVGARVQYKLNFDDGTTWQEVTGLSFAVTNGQPGIYDAGNIGTGLTINWNNGPIQKVTLNQTGQTLSFSNAVAGSTYTLLLVQDSGGGKSVTLTGWDFGDNTPIYNTGANKKNLVSGLYDGTEYLAAFAVKGA
jgi:hypothetical protein